MKTKKILFALSLSTILLALSSINVNAGNGHNINPIGLVKYQVLVHADASAWPYQIAVFITDDEGNLVVHPQILEKGKTEYTFGEAGPVNGVRIATMAVYPFGSGIDLGVKPNMQDGPFKIGQIVTFNLELPAPNPTGEVGVLP